jgi:hypothetical protein
VGPEGRLSGWLKVARLACPLWRGAVVAELQGSGPGGPVLVRGRFYWASLRVARWVANRCVRVGFQNSATSPGLGFYAAR